MSAYNNHSHLHVCTVHGVVYIHPATCRSGSISAEDVRVVCKEMKVQISDEELEKLVAK